MNLNGLNQYKSVDVEASVHTASPHQLIVMLYEGALKALAMAKGGLERGDIELRTKQINKATDILIGLRGMLDHEQGGEIAGNLDALYDYMVRTLMTANREADSKKVQEVMNLILEVKAGWAGIPVEYHQG
ncbi:MAG: flagellar export chaperone FliS [Pontibacterium sp.]